LAVNVPLDSWTAQTAAANLGRENNDSETPIAEPPDDISGDTLTAELPSLARFAEVCRRSGAKADKIELSVLQEAAAHPKANGWFFNEELHEDRSFRSAPNLVDLGHSSTG
jgi:hypothetical protein